VKRLGPLGARQRANERMEAVGDALKGHYGHLEGRWCAPGDDALRGHRIVGATPPRVASFECSCASLIPRISGSRGSNATCAAPPARCCRGHKLPKIEGTYDRHAYLAEKRDASG
jgi:hypothetical protein